MPSKELGMQEPDRQVESACPYCGVGCLLTFNVKDEKIIYVEGRDGPANKSRLCVKGRYGFDYIHNDRRLTKPLIRKPDAPKVADIESLTEADINNMFREATWEEALDFAANGLKDIRDERGGNALAGFGSAKGSNEEAYLFQKLIRSLYTFVSRIFCCRLIRRHRFGRSV